MTVSLHGTTAIREVSDSGNVANQSGRTERTFVWEGLYSELEAQMPQEGAQWAQDPNFFVQTSRLSNRRGKIGRLTVVYVKELNLQVWNAQNNLTIEIDWVRDEAPFQHVGYVAGQDMCDVMALIDDFLSERDVATRATIKANIIAMGATAEQFLVLKAAGISSYTFFRPIVRKMSESMIRPTITDPWDLNKRQSPQIGNTASYPLKGFNSFDNTNWNWVYIKQVDRLVRNGRRQPWVRHEEWHGFIPPKDADLLAAFNQMYPAAT